MDRCRRIFDTAAGEIGAPFAFVLKSRPDRVAPELFAYLKTQGLSRVYLGVTDESRGEPRDRAAARFAADIEPVLDQTCATSGCHTAADTAAGLNLESGASYDELVGRAFHWILGGAKRD